MPLFVEFRTTGLESQEHHSQSTRTTPAEEKEKEEEEEVLTQDLLAPEASEMALETGPRVEVQLKATRICYLSGNPRFDFVLLLTLRNAKEPVLFLKNGLQHIKQFQSINSDQIVQCIDNDTGEQVQILRQGTKEPSYLRLEPGRGGYVTFTTCGSPRPYELAFDTSSLLPDHRYRLRFRQTDSITHWPAASEESLDALPSPGPEEWSAADIPTPSPTKIPWIPVGDNDITFTTLPSPSAPPKITATLSAPSTLSLSNNPPFTFTLTFSVTEPPKATITVLAERPRVACTDSDIEILDAETGARIGPEPIELNVDGPWQREDFVRIDNGTYTETRTFNPKRLTEFGDQGLQVGREYVLRHLGGKWEWWSEDPIDEVMKYAGERGSMGLGRTEGIEFKSGGEGKFRVVE